MKFPEFMRGFFIFYHNKTVREFTTPDLKNRSVTTSGFYQSQPSLLVFGHLFLSIFKFLFRLLKKTIKRLKYFPFHRNWAFVV